jgi:hypothetical protein
MELNGCHHSEVNTNKPTLRGILHHPEFINNEA